MNKINKVKELKLIANGIRQDIIKELTKAKSGHSAGSLGMTDVFTALYFNVLNHNPKKPQDKKRDRLILSNGHICPVLYATLANANYFPRSKLSTLRKLGSKLQGHPHMYSLPGIENSSGPLGQGISLACGVALSAKMDKKSFHTYCSLGDGEINEGQAWEAFMFASKYKLDNLTAFIDRNYIQIDGNTEDIMPLNPLKKKLNAFGWHTLEVNGHNFKKIIKSLKTRKKGKPVAIIFNTIPGKGVSFMENKYEWHGKAPSKEQAKIALEELQK